MTSIDMVKRRGTNFKLSYIVAVFIPLVALGRCCFYSGDFTLLCSVCMLIIGILVTGFRIEIIDVLIMLSVAQMFLLKCDGYPYHQCMYCVIGALSFLFFKGKRSKDLIGVALNTIALFSVINGCITIINFVAPDIYFNCIDVLLLPEYAEDSKYYYNVWGNICGLADHYSRNAYFCVAGCLVFCAKFLSQKRNKKRNFVLAVSELILLVCLGKRGHLLFMIASIALVYLATEPKLSARIIRLLKVFVILCIALAIAMEFIPSSVIDFSIIFTHDAADISTGRFALWEQALELFKENPILGKGYGYFTTHTKNTTINTNFAGVHNDYLQWLCEEGVVGFLINVVIMVLALKKGLHLLKLALKHQILLDSEASSALLWSILFQLFIIMYSLTGLPHFDYEISIIYYIAMAVPYMIAEHSGERTRSSLKFSGIIKQRI